MLDVSTVMRYGSYITHDALMRKEPTMPRFLSTLRRVLPATFRGSASQTEISNPVTAPAGAESKPWLVDSAGRCFVRLA